MSDRWKVTIDRWPYSTGKGQDVDQLNAGERTSVFEVRATDISEALVKAKLYQQGIESSPHVWQAPISKIEQVR